MTDTAYGTGDYTRTIAKIASTHLGYEDHGIFTAMLSLDYGGSGQGTSGYFLGPQSGPAAAKFIMGVLDACGVDRWERLTGRTVYALIEGGLVRGLEPLPTERGKCFLFANAVEASA